MGEQPDVYELNGDSFEKQDGDSDDEEDKNVTSEVDVGYPEEVIDQLEQETDVELPKSADEMKDMVGKLEFDQKINGDADFAELSSGDKVLIDTPLEGAKVGKVTELDEAWTGTLEAKVDTGANEYVVTPFDDDHDTSFVGEVENTMDLKQDVLSVLNRRTAPEVSEGDDLVIDVPEVGPTRAIVEDSVDTENQGKRLTLSAGGTHFVVYEKPTPTQTKEQAYIVGEFR